MKQLLRHARDLGQAIEEHDVTECDDGTVTVGAYRLGAIEHDDGLMLWVEHGEATPDRDAVVRAVVERERRAGCTCREPMVFLLHPSVAPGYHHGSCDCFAGIVSASLDGVAEAAAAAEVEQAGTTTFLRQLRALPMGKQLTIYEIAEVSGMDPTKRHLHHAIRAAVEAGQLVRTGTDRKRTYQRVGGA